MRATAKGHTYEAESWEKLLVAVLLRTGARVLYDERREAVNQLKKGVSVVISGGILIKPEGARE